MQISRDHIYMKCDCMRRDRAYEQIESPVPTMRHQLMLGSRIYCYKIKFIYTYTCILHIAYAHVCMYVASFFLGWSIHFVARFVISGIISERARTSALLLRWASCKQNHNTKPLHTLCSCNAIRFESPENIHNYYNWQFTNPMDSILLNVTHWTITSILHSFYAMEWTNDTRIR